MRRLHKWVVGLVVLVPLILFLVAWGLFEVTPQQKFRTMAAQQIGRQIHRQIEIGPVHFAWSGLEVDDLRLSQVSTFKAGTFLSAKGVRLGWALPSLWKGLDIKKKFITRSSGNFHIDEFQNPHYRANDFLVRWSLTDMDPTWSHVNGWAKLEQGTGLLQNIDQLMTTSPSTKIALTPVLALMNLERLGFLKLGLPDLSHWPIQGIHGDYAFNDGRMTIKQFVIDSPQLGMETTGIVELASGALSLEVQLHAPGNTRMGALDAKLRISGTTAHPKVDLTNLKKKAFQATISNFLQSPEGAKALQNLFR